ncbi:MAG TPA: thiol reductant ABC exporter subunit CydD, partial [Marinobacter adhaerens]|nr:thiol reductant ABC exporter subunit CydD [Marinobacter adhaerens]
QKAVKGWLAQLALGNRLWIRSAVAAGTVAGIATIIQMVLLARIIHLGVIDEVPIADLTPLFLGLILALVVRALGQGFQTRFAARCSEQVRRDARRQL